jgi:hypothetical protein
VTGSIGAGASPSPLSFDALCDEVVPGVLVELALSSEPFLPSQR